MTPEQEVKQQQQKIAAIAALQAIVGGWGTEPDADEPNDESEVTAQPTLLTAEQVAELKARAASEIPVWETPSHAEIDLTTVTHEDLGLDPYDWNNPLVRKIYEAQIQAETARKITESLTSFEQRAQILLARNIPVAPLPPKQKFPPPKGWEKLATTDPVKIAEWAHNGYADGNAAAVARAESGGSCFFEVDKPNFHKVIQEKTGQKFPDTFMVASRPGEGRGHFYFKHTAESIALGNAQAKDESGKEAWSFRADNRYVVGPQSIHPEGPIYTIVKDVPIVEIPSWLVSWMDANKTSEKTGHAELDDQSAIAEGSRNSTLASIAGKARQVLGMDKEQLFTYLLSVNEKRCKPPLPESEVRTIANSIGRYEVKDNTPVPVKIGGYTTPVAETIPVIDDPSDEDPRFEMKGDYFDTKVYDNISEHYVPYPDPGNQDLISMVAHKLVHGTNIPLAFAREPLKAMVLHVLDGRLVHPAYPELSLRGNYFSIAEADDGKTKGLEWAIEAAEIFKGTVHFQNLFQYKSETTFIRSFTPNGTQKRDRQGNVIPNSGVPGHASQFLYIKEGNLVKNSSDYFAGVFAMLTNLYDQTEAATESMTNGNFTATGVKTSTVMCFTRGDFVSTFGGKGNIGGGGLSRWGITNPPPIHDYDDKDWERLSYSERQQAIGDLAVRVSGHRFAQGQEKTEPTILVEEPGATKIRLEVKQMLKKAGKVGKRLMDYFIREQVALAATAVDGRLVMTTEQAEYARKWVEAQVQCRLNCWPSDANSQIEIMEHAMRKAVYTHFVSETRLKDASHYYREGSGGWFAYSSALKNMLASGAIKLTGKTRKGTRAYCPESCAVHPRVQWG